MYAMHKRHPSADLDRAAARMNRVLPRDAVANLLGVSDETVRRAAKNHGVSDAKTSEHKSRRQGKETILNNDDRKVSDKVHERCRR